MQDRTITNIFLCLCCRDGIKIALAKDSETSTIFADPFKKNPGKFNFKIAVCLVIS